MFLLGKTHLPITPYHSVSSDTKDEEVDIHPSIHHENNPGCQKTFLYDVHCTDSLPGPNAELPFLLLESCSATLTGNFQIRFSTCQLLPGC